MRTRLRLIWAAMRDGLWFVPALMTLAAAGLAVLLVELERAGRLNLGTAEHWLVGGGAEGARNVLSAIAGGLFTVTGVTFSVTIVALQLASSQFTPRVLRNFTADRTNQAVLGVFIATFTYALLVLRVVRSAGEGQEEFVPRIAVAVAILLVLASVAALIHLIHHAARSMQICVILDRVACGAIGQVEELFPETVGRPNGHATNGHPGAAPAGDGCRVAAARGGYLQAVDADTLFGMGERKRLTIRMEPRIGSFVLPGRPLATVWPAAAVDEEVVRAVRAAFVLGPDRTPEQDVEFALVEMADVAVKALSPGINDPTTAFRSVDRLAEVLAVLGSREPPADRRTREGKVHFLARYTEFERAVELAFGQIAHFGKSNPAVVRKLVETAEALAEVLPEGRRPPLLRLAEELRADGPARTADRLKNGQMASSR